MPLTRAPGVTDSDATRWFWIGRLAWQTTEWAGPAWLFAEEMPTPAGVDFPIAAALAISRIARRIVDGDSYAQILDDLGQSQVTEDMFANSRKQAQAVAEALSAGTWPEQVPRDARAAELFFTEAWAAARSLQVGRAQVQDELVERWGVSDPRMLDYLGSLRASPFEGYVDLLTQIVDMLDQSETKAILTNLRWQASQDPNHKAAVERFDGLPGHIADVAEEMAYVMRLDRKLERLCQASLEQAPDRHAGFADARQVVNEQRAALVAVMQSFTAHEVDLVRETLDLNASASVRTTSEAPLDRAAHLPTTNPDEALPRPVRTKASAVKRDLDPIAISVRLRRLWTDELGPWLEAIDNDLGSVWRDTLLRRVGLTLDVISPINFGDGDPMMEIGEHFIDRLADATNGHVNRVRVSFLGHAKYTPPRRAQTTDLDIFDPGDPVATRGATASQVGERLSRTLEHEARASLTELRVSAASHHRIWLVAPTPEAARAVSTTPGAAHSLWDAVRRTQGVAKDPLYAIYSDQPVWADSPSMIG